MRRELSKKVATIHAQTVVEKIKSLTCPVEQKAKLINTIRHIHQNEEL